MRVIERKMLDAIKAGKTFNLANTGVLFDITGQAHVYLHNNKIAIVDTDKIVINMCGYPTNTTRSRLHAILQCHNLGICQRKGKQYLIRNLREARTYTEIDCDKDVVIHI